MRILALLLFVFFSAFSSNAQNLNALRNRIDSFAPVISKLQEAYIARSPDGGYFQVAPTHTARPKGGEKRAPDRAAYKKHDQQNTFAEFLADPDNVLTQNEKSATAALLTSMEAVLQIDAIRHPDGSPVVHDWRATHTIEDGAGRVWKLTYLKSELVNNQLPVSAQWEEFNPDPEP